MQNNGKVPYYDIKEDRLKENGPKVLGTEEDYFSNRIEKELNKEVEKPFSFILNKMKKNPLFEVEMTGDEELCIKRYFSVSMFRSDFTSKDFKNNSVLAQWFPDQVIHDFIIAVNLKGGIIEYVNSRSVSILENQSRTPFVTSRNGYGLIKCNNSEWIIIPFTPFRAIGLIPSDRKEKHKIIPISDDESIKYINEQIASIEYVYNGDFIISIDKAELSRLQEILKLKKEELDKIINEFVH